MYSLCKCGSSNEASVYRQCDGVTLIRLLPKNGQQPQFDVFAFERTSLKAKKLDIASALFYVLDSSGRLIARQADYKYQKLIWRKPSVCLIERPLVIELNIIIPISKACE